MKKFLIITLITGCAAQEMCGMHKMKSAAKTFQLYKNSVRNNGGKIEKWNNKVVPWIIGGTAGAIYTGINSIGSFAIGFDDGTEGMPFGADAAVARIFCVVATMVAEDFIEAKLCGPSLVYTFVQIASYGSGFYYGVKSKKEESKPV